jgi:hypothetical protein
MSRAARSPRRPDTFVRFRPVLLTLEPREVPADVSIDATWLAARSAPYLLDQADTTYQLATDVTTRATAFVATAANVTLDLNGHTITYADAPAPVVANGGFEQAAADGSIPGWDLSAAPTARLAPARTGMWGASMLHLGPFTTAQRIVSDPIAVPVAGREYAAVVTPKSSNYDVRVTVTVLDAANGAALAVVMGSEPTSANSQRGFSAWARFIPPAATAAVRLQIDVVPPAGASRTVDLDDAGVFASRDYGVVATRSSAPVYVSAAVASLPDYRRAANFTLTDTSAGHSGGVAAGRGRPFEGDPLYFGALPGLTVDHIHTFANGMDANNLEASNASNIRVRASTFDADIDHLSNRQRGFGSIHINGASGELELRDNTILNSPMAGIYLVNHTGGNASTITIAGNVIRPRAIVADGYGLLLNGLSGFEVSDNVIAPVTGRGILFDGFNQYVTRHGSIHDNTVSAYERPNLEYDAAGLEATALRLRNYAGSAAAQRDLTFRGNTFTARTDDAGVRAAIGLSVSWANDLGQMAGANDLFEGNTFTAVVDSTDAARKAYAVSFAGVAAGTGVLFRNNVLESNDRTLNIGDREEGYGAPVQDVLMVGNRHRRSADGPARPQFRTTVVGDGNNPVSGVRLIGSHYENGAAADLAFVGPQPKAVSIGWLVTVAVKNGAGAPYSGALVRIYDLQNVPVFGGYTDASGRVTAPLVTMTYAQDGPDARAIRTDDRRPFRLLVSGYHTWASIDGLSFTDDTLVSVFLPRAEKLEGAGK